MDLNEQVARRRAELARQRGERNANDDGASDVKAVELEERPTQNEQYAQRVATAPSTGGGMHDLVAARRAEIEEERTLAKRALNAAAAAAEIERRAVAEKEWAQRSRLNKARLDENLPSKKYSASARRRKSEIDRMLREGVRGRRTTQEKTIVGVALVSGFLMMIPLPLFGIVIMAFGWFISRSFYDRHKKNITRDYPDLFVDEYPAGQ